jgi:hypothetical protein
VPPRALLYLALVLASACARRAPDHAPPDAAPLAALSDWETSREAARAVLVAHCGECHDPGSPGVLRAALRVYDLGAVEWSATMSPAQLRDANGRLAGSVVPTQTDAEMLPMSVSDAERATFLHFVELSEARQMRDR